MRGTDKSLQLLLSQLPNIFLKVTWPVLILKALMLLLIFPSGDGLQHQPWQAPPPLGGSGAQVLHLPTAEALLPAASSLLPLAPEASYSADVAQGIACHPLQGKQEGLWVSRRVSVLHVMVPGSRQAHLHGGQVGQHSLPNLPCLTCCVWFLTRVSPPPLFGGYFCVCVCERV